MIELQQMQTNLLGRTARKRQDEAPPSYDYPDRAEIVAVYLTTEKGRHALCEGPSLLFALRVPDGQGIGRIFTVNSYYYTVDPGEK